MRDNTEEIKSSLTGHPSPHDGLTRCSVAAYALGHVYNDLCAAVWFNYLLFYVTKVVGIPPQYSG